MHELTITGPRPPRRMELDDGSYVIGRLPTNAICLDGDGISREHARLEVSGGSAVVLDLGSMNGTRVDGVPVERKRLEDGDIVSVGDYQLLYRLSSDPSDLTVVSEIDHEASSRRNLPMVVGAAGPMHAGAGDEELKISAGDRGNGRGSTGSSLWQREERIRRKSSQRLSEIPKPGRASERKVRPRRGEPTEEMSRDSLVRRKDRLATPGMVEERVPPVRRVSPVAPAKRQRLVSEEDSTPSGEDWGFDDQEEETGGTPAHRVARDRRSGKPRRRVKVNFRMAFSIWLLLLVVGVTLFIGVGLIGLAEDMMGVEAKSRARTLAYLVAEMNLPKLRAGDVGLITEPISRERGVNEVLILGLGGEVVAPEERRGVRSQLLKRAADAQKFLMQLTPSGGVFSVPIAFGRQRYGTAVVDFGVSYLREKKRHMATLVVMFGLFFGALALVVAIFLEKQCHRPFRQMAQELNLALKQDLELEVPPTTDRRVNELVDAVNRVLDRAAQPSQAASGRMDGPSGGLEVVRRTADLLGEGLVIADGGGLVDVCNSAAMELLGCRGGGASGQHLLDLFASASCLAEIMELLRESRLAPREICVQRLRVGHALEARAVSFSQGARLVTVLVIEQMG